MPPVQKKPMIFIVLSTFPSIATCADSPRLRFNYTRDPFSQKVCLFHPKNNTSANPKKYKKKESACGPCKGPNLAIFSPSAHIEVHDSRRSLHDNFFAFRHRPKKVSGLSSLFSEAPKTFWAPLGAPINCVGAHFSVPWTDSAIS